MKKILITGASGFIGSFLVEEALSRGYEVYAGVRQSSSRKYLTDERIKFLQLNFEDVDLLNAQISVSPYFDFVIHNAALTKGFNKNDYYVSNYYYTRHLVNALIKQDKIPQKFIYMSSLAAYGPGSPVSLNIIKADDTPAPVTMYGKSKLESEKYLASLSNFPHINIRPTAVYGPREKNLLTVFKLINNNLELIIGSHKQHLTFIYVKDLVNIIYEAMESAVINKGFFVSDGNIYDAQTLGNIIKERLGKKTLRLNLPINLVRIIAMIAESTKYISGKQSLLNLEKVNELECVNWKCDIEPLINAFNYKPKYDLTSGVNETIDWYKEEKWLK